MSGEGTSEAVSKLDSLKGLSNEEILTRIQSDPDLANEILDDKVFTDWLSQQQSTESGNQGSTATGESGTASPQGTPGSQGTDGGSGNTGTDDEEFTITLKKSMLGTYGKNRNPVEAIQEMVKGYGEKDKFIDFLKKEKLPLVERELDSTKSELLSTRQKLDELLKQSQKPLEIDAAADEDVLPENFDALDPDHVSSLVKTIKDLRTKVKTFEAGKAPAPQLQPQAAPATAHANNPAEMEYAQVRLLTKNPQYAQYFGGMQRDVADIENDYIGFVRDLAILNGYTGQVIDASGKFAPKVVDVLRMYQDTSNAAGDQIRSQATDRGIKPPEDMAFLNTVYKVKNARNSYMRNSANGPEPISWEDAMAMVALQNPISASQTPPPNPAVESHNRMQKAIENRGSFSKEPSASDGADLSNVLNIPESELKRLIDKPMNQYTPVEKETMIRFLRDGCKMSDKEIEHYFKRP